MFGKNVVVTCISGKQYAMIEAAKWCTLWFFGLYIVGKIEQYKKVREC
jgi:hypothetical protein